jgi:hypothetical protein
VNCDVTCHITGEDGELVVSDACSNLLVWGNRLENVYLEDRGEGRNTEMDLWMKLWGSEWLKMVFKRGPVWY